MSKSNKARSNAILNSLPQPVFDQLLPKLQPVELKIGTVLYQPDTNIDHVYFPTAGIISLLAAFEDGSTVEAGVIGNEGFLGMPVALGGETTPHQAVVQVPGQAMRITARDLKTQAHNDGALFEGMLLYTNVMFTQVAQTAACNRVHMLDQRLARWLLLTHDRVDGDEFPLTQEFISTMLGVRRAGVSVAANELRQAGVIAYRRGFVTVANRQGLEERSCECYQVVRDAYDRYLQS